jgi:hypothetical protein
MPEQEVKVGEPNEAEEVLPSCDRATRRSPPSLAGVGWNWSAVDSMGIEHDTQKAGN